MCKQGGIIMRISIISDTHFGDQMGTLIEYDENGTLDKGRLYDKFHEAVGKNNDYLVLLGDILDFSIVGYVEAYQVAKKFFELILNDEVAKEIIYIPGNHDADMWHIVEHQVKIIRHMEKGEPPKPFRMSVPGLLDDRKTSKTKGFTLVDVDKNQNGPNYGGLYLDNITLQKPTTFNFAYPNLYFVTDEESLILTHGHYLERYWSFISEWVMKIAQEDLKVGGALSLEQMVGVNFPFNQLACSGVGQAGPLTKILYQIQREVKDKNLKRVKKYLDRLDNEIDQLTRYPWYKQYLEWFSDVFSSKIKKMIIDKLEEFEETRYNAEFIHKEEVQKRFWNFYDASLIEIDQLRSKGYEIPTPLKILFGHTHDPILWEETIERVPKTSPIKATGLRPIYLYNTGGWLRSLNEQGQEEFRGAGVFQYETDRGFSSVLIN